MRPAEPAEAGPISELALRSKAHWGYDDGFLAACRAELTVHPEQCDGVHVVVAVRGAALLGFYGLAGIAPRGELWNLFVDPPAIGTGIGGLLLRDAVRRARGLGMAVLTIDADPYAEAFYLHAGAVRIGSVPSGSLPGRVLPRLELSTRQAGAR